MSTAELTTATDEEIHAALVTADNEVAEAEKRREAIIAERRRRQIYGTAEDVANAIAYRMSGGKRGTPWPTSKRVPPMAMPYETPARRELDNAMERRIDRSDANLNRCIDAAY